MIEKMTKLRHQIKSSHYYMFWGLCTIAVVFGQIYVGTGYRQMSNSINQITEKLK